MKYIFILYAFGIVDLIIIYILVKVCKVWLERKIMRNIIWAGGSKWRGWVNIIKLPHAQIYEMIPLYVLGTEIYH
jgi:hypothetical protein